MKTRSRWITWIGALLLIFSVGCAEEPEVVTTDVDTESTTEVEADEEVPRLPDGSEPHQVVLSSFEIEMPKTLYEGTNLFTVSNESEMEHNFEIEGQGIEQSFEKNLQAGEVKTMEVDLVPGEYRVYCPVDDHAEQGMKMTLTVKEGEPTTDTGEMNEGEDGDEESSPADEI